MKAKRRALAALLALAAERAAQEPCAPARTTREPAQQGERVLEVPRRRSPGAQLAQARSWKGKLGPRASAAEADLERVVAAYRAVRRYHPKATRLGAEAAFRAGRLYVEAGRYAEARGEFEWARRLDPEGRFGLRATLESAHMLRRQTRYEQAKNVYLTLVEGPDIPASLRDEAGHWTAWILRAEDRVAEAQDRWRRIAEQTRDPVRRVRSFDEIGLCWLARGDLEAAAGVLDECLQASSQDAREETFRGERTRHALARMRLARALSRAVAERKRSSDRQLHPRNP